MWSIYIAGEYGGMNESMAELFRITGKKEFLEAARFFDNDRLFYPLEQGVDALDGMHANQHIPQVIGAVKMYEMTGEKRYYGLASLFWKIVTCLLYTSCFLDGEEFHDFVKTGDGYIRIDGVPSGRYEWSVG